MTLPATDPIAALLLTSLIAAAVLAFVRDYRWSARLNILASLAVLLIALRLFLHRPAADDFFLADDLNVGLDLFLVAEPEADDVLLVEDH